MNSGIIFAFAVLLVSCTAFPSGDNERFVGGAGGTEEFDLSDQIQQIAGVFDQMGDYLQERMDDLHSTCPTQASQCGFPASGGELMSMVMDGLDSVHDTATCMRESGCKYAEKRVKEILQSILSENEHAAEVVEQVSGLLGTVNDKIQERITDVHSKCSSQASQCGFPAPDTDLVSLNLSLGGIHDTMKCMQESGCRYGLLRLEEIIQDFISQNETLTGFVNRVDELKEKLADFANQVGSFFDQVGDLFDDVHDEVETFFGQVGNWFDNAGQQIAGFFQQLFG